MCLILYGVVGIMLYITLFRWMPEIIVKLVALGGMMAIIYQSVISYDTIIKLVDRFSITQMFIGLTLLFIFAVVLITIMLPNKAQVRKGSKRKGSVIKKNYSPPKNKNKQNQFREDHVILSSSLKDLSGAEFERLLALYFRDNGYEVREVGIGGNDGGVDLVIIDRRGEKTAVQAKCYADHNTVGVSVVRELVGAKRNHDCILTLLVTTSDLTASAKREAEQMRVEYWHGAIVEQKLARWGKWQPGAKPKHSKARTSR